MPGLQFLVDQPLGGLAKWLRFCGFDTILVRLSLDQPKSLPPPNPKTYLLTRQAASKRLKRPDILILAADEPETQLEEVIQRLHILPRHLKPLSRCSHCNNPLVPIDRELVQGRVPEYIFSYQQQFSECLRCHRVYWPGSHIRGITVILREKMEKMAAGVE